MPGIQVHPNDGALAEPRGEVGPVPFVMEEPWKTIGNHTQLQPCMHFPSCASLGFFFLD